MLCDCWKILDATPVANDMSTSIPIFPLGTVLFPGGVLPLKIFEQRYLEMTKICLRDGAPFGVCRIREGLEVGPPAEHDAIGCTAKIEGWDMPHPGLFQLRTTGERVFRVVARQVQADGLIQAQVEWLPEIPGEVDQAALGLCRRVLESVVSRIGAGYFTTPLALDDSRWVSYRLAELLPASTEDKQVLLEERNDALRLSRLAGLLHCA